MGFEIFLFHCYQRKRVARNAIYERRLELDQCSVVPMKIRGTRTVESMSTEDLRRRINLYTILFKVYFEGILNMWCTQYSGICTVII